MNFTPRLLVVPFAILFAFANCGFGQTDSDSPDKKMAAAAGNFAIAIHGGAGASAKDATPEQIVKRKASLQKALDKAVKIIKGGGTSLDAVEAVIVILEDDPQFNSGKGAVFNAVGSHELDASIMNGKDKSCGAVAGVSHVKNPIKLARLVMTETRHVLLSGAGAEVFAKQQNVEWVEPAYFDTDAARESWNRYRIRNPEKDSKLKDKKAGVSMALPVQSKFEEAWKMGTVGCVCLDTHGNLAAGTSTGGMTHKKFGRVGDSPVVGAGTYADNETCAVSSTGTGEEYIRNAIAYDVSAQLKYKKVTLKEAVNDNLNNRLKKGDGGLIAVDKDGNIAMGFTTRGMARAAADSKGRNEVIWGD